MNGNGTADEAMAALETANPANEIPAPPPWMHDFLPASCIFDCQGPDCDQSARAYWQNNVGFIAPGWQAMDQRPFCSWLCVARYAALKAQEQIDTVQTEGDRPAPGSITMVDTRKRARHN